MQETVLIVEDDRSIAASVSTGLELEGFRTIQCGSAEDALTILPVHHIDIALLDIRLPGMDGLNLCRTLREQGHTFPVIMLTARDEELDKVLGLEMGADDYMVKPYGYRELLSRIRAQLRRATRYSSSDSEGELVDFGQARVDFLARRAFRDGREIDITPVEFRIMLVFKDHENQSLSRQQIIDAVWGQDFFLEDPRTVDVHIRHLREKLETDPSSPRHIQTVRGHGYRFIKNP
ncbi:response regulator transcription factor [Salinispira pacifica]|uniref:Phosphate regulon transcriptional regulatory protein PhoB n=1 Tax=Salinispira pacifica TaxID=1307761 RepID=V5WE35_9SPIO|nr:response regulator transcription factor [Salinispira pacifica]AHC13900.1 Phosphate regulon transcriptional regulatory protein PhoB (SphR) [Salinispira pacifica]